MHTPDASPHHPRGTRRHPTRHRTIVLLALAVALAAAAPAAASTGKRVADLVDQATYEVVVKKPADNASGLAYERELPWEMVPYAIRTDAYLPLGTAFAIGDNTFVSANHVMQIPGPTQWGEMFLRDHQGKVYAIDTVSKESVRRDFVVFSLADPPDRPHFRVRRKPSRNERVYAVGNALGQGIVMREGRFTSRTPEDYKGAWKWLRFSAAASPGNSGGPLLDEQGRALGVVVMKSKNENLNYALPIAEVLGAEDGVGRMETRLGYRIENMDKTLQGEADLRVRLPRSLSGLRRAMTRKFQARSQQLADRFFAKYRDEIFPRGEGATRLLHNNYNAVFPNIIGEGPDGTWDSFQPKGTSTSDLGHNGSVAYGAIDHTLAMLVHKPDNLPMERFTHDSKRFMDLILKAVPFKRQIGQETVRMTSLGKAERDSLYTDAFGRKWQIRTWSIPYRDARVITASLPVPGGNVTLLKSTRTRRTDGFIYDLKHLADFLNLSYYGTLEEWRDYLALDDLLPAAYDDIDIDFAYGDHFRYDSQRLSLAYGPDLMDLKPDSDLKLYFAYFEDGGEVVWDVAEVQVGENKNTKFLFAAERNPQPAASMDDEAKEGWTKVADHRFPYNGDPFFKDDRTFVGSVWDRGLPAEKLDAADHLYTVIHIADGEEKDKVMSDRLERFLKGMKVKEEPF